MQSWSRYLRLLICSVIGELSSILTTQESGFYSALVCVRVFAFVQGAECSIRKGSAKAFDQNELVHEIWTLALQQRIHLWVERVESKRNISDCPSRFEYRLLEELGASWREPRIHKVFLA